MAIRQTRPSAMSGTGPYVTTPREDLVTVMLASLLIGGSLADAWAHSNLASELETFFTPWHGLLYGGFAATAAWTIWLAFRRRGGTPRWWREGWPAGYALGALGAVGFLAAGVGDMLWHTIFGVEVSLDAVLSPTHLLLAVAGTLLVTSPLRSWWASGTTRSRALTGLASLGLGSIFGVLLLSHTTAFRSTAATRAYDFVTGSPSHLEASYGSARYLATTLILLIPVLLVLRRRAVLGTATAVLGAIFIFQLAQFNFPATLTLAGIGATLGAFAVDVLAVRLDAVRGPDAPLRLPIVGALFGSLVWSGHLLGLAIGDGVRWPVELWTGNVVLAAIAGAMIGLVASPPSKPVTTA
ncbi:hypothetical protein [Virgisporangium ochraceum]|uniref:Uncharacterized protein n=1 Tax=Virgisporangium ochraceum TaxID=65505 RepID=A0A8J4EFH7_9ACTN|nr:hypothetical protein [Virgisporangium ochraceum]GIJ72834.1 hypothetical protein Voc01_077510 [Virgisporangium ochraceum]